MVLIPFINAQQVSKFSIFILANEINNKKKRPENGPD